MLKANSTKVILAGVSAIAMLASSPAQAQIDEIIVTAQKREENVQDVSISVTALNEKLLELGGINDVSRLELVTPGVNFAFAGNDAKFNVRGANSTNTFGDNSSIVGAFQDGVYKARASQQTRGFYDVSSVEFLRGPQGTLYGRNTFAGALNLYTNKPELEEYSAGIEASYQRFDRMRGEAFFNIPVSETFALRVAGYLDKSDGYVKNFAGPDVGAQDDKGLRVSALWAPTDDLEIVARYQYSGEDGNEAGLFGYTFLCRNVTPDGLTDAFGSERDCQNPIRGSGGLGPASNGPGGDPYVIAQDYIQPVELVDHNLSLNVEYDMGNVIVKSITNYNEFENDIGFDFDFGPTPNQNGGYDEESKGWSQEFQINSDYDSQLQWTAGLYYSDLEDRNTFYIYNQTERRPNSDRATVVTPQFPGGVQLLTGTGIEDRDRILNGFFANNVVIDTEYFGIYAQGEYSLTDQFRLIGGLRYNDETKAASCGGSNFSGGDRVVNVLPGVAGSSPAILPTNAQDLFSYNCDAADAVTSATVSDFPGNYDNITWRAGAEYDLTDDVMLYATGATGYLSGSASTASTTEEQTSRAFEGGFRSRLAGNTLQLNGAVHFTTYDNLLTQRQEIDPVTQIALTFTDNGGDIEAWGIEMDAVWQPTDELTLTGTLAYLNSEFKTFGQGNPYQLYRGEITPFIDQSGNTTPWSPDLTLGASAAYAIDLGDKGTLTPYAQTYYSGGYNTSNLLANDPNHYQESFTKTDLRLIWDAPSENYSIEVFIENIENSAVLARGNNNSDDIVQTSYLYPRNNGIKFKARF